MSYTTLLIPLRKHNINWLRKIKINTAPRFNYTEWTETNEDSSFQWSTPKIYVEKTVLKIGSELFMRLSVYRTGIVGDVL